MNQLLLIAALLIGGWYAWRKVRRAFGRAMRTSRDPKPGAGRSITLEKDPATGVYRPPDA
jgi:hypothetical protein